jgi:uncharacterized protein YycO
VPTHRTIYCRGSVLSAAIRLFDGMGHWSHCAGVLQDGEHVVEALAWRGVVITPLAEVIRRSSAHRIEAREVPMAGVGDAWALSTVGAGYDWLGAIGSPWRRPWGSPEAWYCSEHAEAWLLASGAEPRWRPGKRGVTPNEHYWAV